MKRTIDDITCESSSDLYFRKLSDPISKSMKVWYGREDGEDYDSAYVLRDGRFIEVNDEYNIVR